MEGLDLLRSRNFSKQRGKEDLASLHQVAFHKLKT